MSLILNLLYAAFKVAVGAIYRSLWQSAEAIYYCLLIIIRLILASEERRFSSVRKYGARLRQWRVSLACGLLLLFFGLLVSAAIGGTVSINKSYRFSGIVLYSFAGYTVYRITVSVIQLIKFRRLKYPILSTSKAVNLSASAMSFFALGISLISAFEKNPEHRLAMSSVLGASVSAAVVFLSAATVLNAIKNIKSFQ